MLYKNVILASFLGILSVTFLFAVEAKLLMLLFVFFTLYFHTVLTLLDLNNSILFTEITQNRGKRFQILVKVSRSTFFS